MAEQDDTIKLEEQTETAAKEEQTTETASGEQKEDTYTLKNFGADVMDILEAALLTVFLFLLIFAYILRPVTVDGSSMNPTLYHEDNLVILTCGYQPKNGQIVVIDDQYSGHYLDYDQKEVYETQGMGIVLIKRLIAHGGQEVDIDFENGIVKVDGAELDEPYIADPTTMDEGAFHYPITIPEGYVFVMGDNRLHSTDSRSPSVALIPTNEILGTGFFRYNRTDELCQNWKDRFAFLF
ncbi:MAG: signal peptidase I [Oscillospiraceae bacterium]|nr:signal peptidase I [Oscillospiraceae bacterium]